METSPVFDYPDGRSPYGCFDMAGNTWEWTRSLWGENPEESEYKYPYKPEDGREILDAPDSVRRVSRGGAFDHSSRHVRCASHGRYNFVYGHNVVGFLVVVSLTPEP